MSTPQSVSIVASQRSPSQLQKPNSTPLLQKSLESPMSTLAVSSSPTTTTTTTPSPLAFCHSTIINSNITTTSTTNTPTMMDWKQLEESLTCNEIVIKLVQEGKTVQEIIICINKVKLTIENFTLDEIMSLSNSSLHNAKTNIRTIRYEQELLNNGLFIPQEDQMLHEWIADRK